MAYGMELLPKNGVTTVIKSYNGAGVGKTVVAINGTTITGFSRLTVKELVDSLKETRQRICLLLDGGSTIDFTPNSAPQDWNRLRETEQA